MLNINVRVKYIDTSKLPGIEIIIQHDQPKTAKIYVMAHGMGAIKKVDIPLRSVIKKQVMYRLLFTQQPSSLTAQSILQNTSRQLRLK